ncbi:hypothetical protein [uncultured Cardiobacterium sp.]|nr:hypothetical protein [uncultured Cardiobacterium sp.]
MKKTGTKTAVCGKEADKQGKTPLEQAGAARQADFRQKAAPPAAATW